jgi:hypothetical protein
MICSVLLGYATAVCLVVGTDVLAGAPGGAQDDGGHGYAEGLF